MGVRISWLMLARNSLFSAAGLLGFFQQPFDLAILAFHDRFLLFGVGLLREHALFFGGNSRVRSNTFCSSSACCYSMRRVRRRMASTIRISARTTISSRNHALSHHGAKIEKVQPSRFRTPSPFAFWPPPPACMDPAGDAG